MYLLEEVRNHCPVISDLNCLSHFHADFMLVCYAGDCQILQSLLAREEAAVFWHGEL